jgi:hypothetical protein
MTAPGCLLPMNVPRAVPREILPHLLEFTALSELVLSPTPRSVQGVQEEVHVP